jgi:hypothetical protein
MSRSVEPRRAGRAGLLLVTCALAWVLIAAAVVIAAPVVPVTLVPSLPEGRFDSLSIGVGDRGDAVASWSEQPLVRAVVRVAHERAGRSRWAISPPLAAGEAARLAVDGRGDAVAIWTSNGAGSARDAIGHLEAAVRPAGLGHWRAPTVIGRLQPCDGCEATPSVVIGAGGEVLIVWSEGSEEEPDTPLAEEPGQVIEAVSGSAQTGRFGSAVALSRATDSSQAPQAALDGRGDAVVVWEACLCGKVFEGRAIQAAWRPSGGGWRPSITLAHANEGPSSPHVAIDADGRAVAVWEQARGYVIHGSESPPTALESAFANASKASWGAAQALSSPRESASNVQLASAPTGRILAVWERDSRTSNAVIAAIGSTASGTWGAQTTVATWGHVAPVVRVCRGGACPPAGRQLPAAAPRLAMNARGDAAVVWEQAGAYRPFVRLARLAASAHDWLTPVRVSAPGASEASVALDTFDDAFVIWQTVSECRAPCQQASAALEVAKLAPRDSR